MSKSQCNFCGILFDADGDETRCPTCRDLPGVTTSDVAESEGTSAGVGCLIFAAIAFVALLIALEWYRSVAFVNWQG